VGNETLQKYVFIVIVLTWHLNPPRICCLAGAETPTSSSQLAPIWAHPADFDHHSRHPHICSPSKPFNVSAVVSTFSMSCPTHFPLQVLCLPDDKTPPTPQARFKSASRYTRVTYLRCSLLQLNCTTDRETYDGPGKNACFRHMHLPGTPSCSVLIASLP
jgi:hypothetical protein